MGIFGFRSKNQEYAPVPDSLPWNEFIWDVCRRDFDGLSPIQKNAVLCFWYDAEVNSGGHDGYFDNCFYGTPKELYRALRTVANRKLAFNFRVAVWARRITFHRIGALIWELNDLIFYASDPSVCDCLMDYLAKHEEEIFRENTPEAAE